VCASLCGYVGGVCLHVCSIWVFTHSLPTQVAFHLRQEDELRCTSKTTCMRSHAKACKHKLSTRRQPVSIGRRSARWR